MNIVSLAHAEGWLRVVVSPKMCENMNIKKYLKFY